jgi:uncharacterized protein (DUF2236 family)
VIDSVFFGARPAPDRATAAVRRVHAEMRGTLPEAIGKFPAGTPWAADDPALLLWILATLADSGALFYERYVGALRRAERDAYWADYRVVGSLFGVSGGDMPADSRELEVYIHDMLSGDVLHVSERARELGVEIVLRPPVPLAHRPLLELANFIIVGLLPGRIRRQYQLGWDPVRAVTLRVGAESAKRLLMPVLPQRVRLRPARMLAA